MSIELSWVSQPPTTITVYENFPSPVIIRYTKSGLRVQRDLFDNRLFFQVELIPVGPLPWDNDVDGFDHIGGSGVYTASSHGLMTFRNIFIAVPGIYRLQISVLFIATQGVREQLLGRTASHVFHVRTWLEAATYAMQAQELSSSITPVGPVATPIGPDADSGTPFSLCHCCAKWPCKCWRYCCHKPDCHLCPFQHPKRFLQSPLISSISTT
jgi:hypothetical protein